MKDKCDHFSGCHPVVNIVFFVGAVIFSVWLLHPAYLLCSLIFGAIYLLCTYGRAQLHYLMRVLMLFTVLSLFNPFLNTYGETVLFTYYGRHYTLEALLYGIALAAMTSAMLLWFSAYEKVITEDKFLYLFARRLPGMTMLLTMTFRLIPELKKKAMQVNQARQCIGRAGSREDKREALRESFLLLSVLVSWALEGGIVTADSMRSRGYGSGSGTFFARYRFDRRDRVLLTVMLILTLVLLYCIGRGGAAVSYTPQLQIAWTGNLYTGVGVSAYALFLALPTAVNLVEDLSWYISRSGI